MDAGYITPFISSVQNVFSTMMQLPVTIGEPRIKGSEPAAADVTGLIGMSGDVVGTVVLGFPMETADRLVALFSGGVCESGGPDFVDAVGELVNMVSGGAKGMFTGNRKVSISCPSVVLGQGHTVGSQSDVSIVVIPCETDCGNFVIELGIQEAASSAKADEHAQSRIAG